MRVLLKFFFPFICLFSPEFLFIPFVLFSAFQVKAFLTCQGSLTAHSYLRVSQSLEGSLELCAMGIV